MTLIVTDAVVLHAFDYMESSRILRLATREAGIQSVVAKGARRPKTRFGTALDLFAEGTAHFSARRGRDLHTLTAFEVVRTRPALATGIARFTGAAAIAELVLRFGSEDAHPEVYDALVDALDSLATALEPDAPERGLAGAWRLVGALGFTPVLDACVSCGHEVGANAEVAFSGLAGGVLCRRCAENVSGLRRLPVDARRALSAWHSGTTAELAGEASVRAHQRLLREFVEAHLAEGKPLRAFHVWEHERWSA